jgi:hypothetical protein
VIRGPGTAVGGTLAGLILAAALATTAHAAVQTGSGDDAAGDGPSPGRDLTGLTVRHDTAAGTTATLTLAAAPAAGGYAYLGAFVGTLEDGACTAPSLTLIGVTDPASPITPSARQSGSAVDIPTTQQLNGPTVTLTTAGTLPGGAEPTCARALIGNLADPNDHYDVLSSFSLLPEGGPPPAPTPPTPPAPNPEPTPPGPTPDDSANGHAGGRWGGAFRVASTVPALTKPGRSYIYGVCRSFSICRVDPATRRSKVLLTGRKGKAYGGVSVSQSGATMSLDYDDAIYRTGRGGTGRQEWSKSGNVPAVRADGRAVIWSQLITVASCFPGIDFVLQCTYPLSPSIQVRALGDKDSKTVETQIVSMAWYRDMIIGDATPDGPDLGNPYMCLLDGKGECGRAVAKDPARAFSSPATSPDGRTLAVVSEPATGADGNQRFRGRIELWNPATGRRLRNLTTGDRDTTPIFSPDGRQVAFNRGSDLLVAPTRGGRPRLLARGVTLTGPSWGLAR